MADDAVAIAICHGVPAPAAAQETLHVMKERMANITRPVDDGHASMAVLRKIQRFPRALRGIGGPDDRYIVPTVVSIGPYHHGQLHLQEMEEVKLAAANRFFADSNVSVDYVYSKLLSIVGDVRGCYADDNVVNTIDDTYLAAMMLLDGCFLMQFMIQFMMDKKEPSLQGRALSSEYCILKDMMLLENQIPWLVLEALMEFLPVDQRSLRGFVSKVGDKFFPKKKDKSCWYSLQAVIRRSRDIPASDDTTDGGHKYETYLPAHLLCLLRFSQIWRMPKKELEYKEGSSSLLSSSAVKLAQIGVKLSASTAAWFGDMHVRKQGIFGVFSLSPVFLNDVTACWLVNMAALEATSTSGYGDFVVSSYLSALAMLMDREEDVQQLRGRRVVLSTFSNTQTLDFFKRISQHLRFGSRYFAVLGQIEEYKKNRWVRIVLYKFVHNNYKVIAAILSIASVLVGIFKALRGR